jgi:DNA-binding response OmpR family regulator
MRLLIIEDEKKLALAMKKGLVAEGFAVDIEMSGPAGKRAAEVEDYDVIILDRMLPGGLDGVDICAYWRENGIHTPVLMVTARDVVPDRVRGLQSGADDYLGKPFDFDELVARVRSLLRRPTQFTSNVLSLGDLHVDTSRRVAYCAERELVLSQKEFSLLEYFLRNPNRILSKQELIDHVWDFDATILPNTVEVYVGYVRQKLVKASKATGHKLAAIRTRRGFGYILEI